MLFEGANIARKPRHDPRATAAASARPHTAARARAAAHRPRSIGRCAINRRCCSARAHPMRTASPSPASSAGSPRPPAASAPPPSFLLAAHQTSAPAAGVEGAGEGPVSVARVFSRSFRCTSRIMRSSCSVFCTAPRSASPTTSERWLADGLQPESGRQAGAGAKGEGARRARSHPRAPPSVSASSPAPPSASPAQAMETFAIAGGGTQSAGGAPCGLGWRTSVPRSFVSSADCACSILSTSTMSCFTLRVATCHRHQQGATPARVRERAMNVGTCRRSRGQARWAGLLKGGDGFAQAHI